MAALAQHHTSDSLSRYSEARSPVEDQYSGNRSTDFCNSFWGPGDDGVNILLSRMRGAAKTTEELRSFWSERAAIEDQYATRLATLAKSTLGSDETGALRHSLNTLRLETENQAAQHMELAARIRADLEVPTSRQHAKQVNHRRNVQAAVERKFKTKQSQESFVAKAREKYEGDCSRITSYTQQIGSSQGKDLERLQLKLKRAQQTVAANEKDFANFSRTLMEILPDWEVDWKEFCDSCQDLEEERVDFMKDTLWAYANAVSTLCVSDDESCEKMRTVLDNLEAVRDIEHFVVDYGTGDLIVSLPAFVPFNGQEMPAPSTPTTRPARFQRVSRRPQPSTLIPDEPGITDLVDPITPHLNGHHNPPSPHIPTTNGQTWSQVGHDSNLPSNHSPPPPVQQPHHPQAAETSPPRFHPLVSGPPNTPPPSPPGPHVPPQRSPSGRHRQSGPLPTPTVPPSDHPPMPTPPPPPPPTEETGGILFYVKALYDYTATIDEEFDFQAGDVIAVTATPDDGWWSGELLDEARREEGRHVFPSNFVCLF
ncbi:hypothetical protein BDZ94DRAFT_1261233 [Collybia nuda]|uniref:SH3 domain-containing protein n=1 Tax=Collybia nuda TaxID=64659 RepID=A0A9P6CHK1_9AGAR|nr:hypothetical protein BDZ94DRAFT_1261233 [Collybia nuda]